MLQNKEFSAEDASMITTFLKGNEKFQLEFKQKVVNEISDWDRELQESFRTFFFGALIADLPPTVSSVALITQS